MITLDELKKSVPATLKKSISQGLVDKINNLEGDPEVADYIRSNIMSYTGVLADGRYKITDYMNAVAYVSHKLMGRSNRAAYQNVFTGRYRVLVAKGTSDKDISSYVSAYNKGKLVNSILEQSLVPVWVLNQDMYQKALNKQMDLMMTASSEKVQTEAANSLLTHLKKPESKAIDLNIGVAEGSGINELQNTMKKLVETQQEMIAKGMTTKQIAHTDIVEAEVVEESPLMKAPA